jgi:hypothetical protein
VEVVPEIEDHEIVDDSVRMYLREIGRVPLLTWEGEKHLAMQMEAGKTLEDIRFRLERTLGREPTAAENLKDIVRRLRDDWHIVQRLCARLHLPADQPVQMIREMGIHFEIDTIVTAMVADELKMPQRDLDSRQIKLAVEARLIPEEALDAIARLVGRRKASLPLPQDVFDAITGQEVALARYQARTRQDADGHFEAMGGKPTLDLYLLSVLEDRKPLFSDFIEISLLEAMFLKELLNIIVTIAITGYLIDLSDLVNRPAKTLLAHNNGILIGLKQPFELFESAPEQVDLLRQEMDIVDKAHDLVAHLGHVCLDLFLLRRTLGLEERILEVLQIGLLALDGLDDLKCPVPVYLLIDIDDVINVHNVFQPDLSVLQGLTDLDDLLDRDGRIDDDI